MKKKNTMTFGQKVGYFFKHYFLLLLLSLCCATLTVMLVALCSVM